MTQHKVFRVSDSSSVTRCLSLY